MKYILQTPLHTFVLFFATTLLFAGGFFISPVFATELNSTVLVEWNFPNDPDDSLADGGLEVNTLKNIVAVGTSEPQFSFSGVNTKSARATGWNTGAGNKYWYVSLETTGYENITLSSQQRSSGTGPRDFTVQYKIGDGSWVETGNSIALSDSWTAGVVENLTLPSETSDASLIYIRWLMTSNTSASGIEEGVESGGASNIDNIVITGTAVVQDGDNDGVADTFDNCVLLPNENQADTDDDGVGDVCDNSPNTANPEQADRDADGIGDASDNCPLVANVDQADRDGDGVGDACDNCSSTPNPSQADTDSNGTGDACESAPQNDEPSEDTKDTPVIHRGGGGSLMQSTKSTKGETPKSDVPDEVPSASDTILPKAKETSGEVLGAVTQRFLTNLGLGTKNDFVQDLQDFLREKGFFSLPVSTGYFGPITLSAVQAFQQHFGLPETGFVGPLTRTKLNGMQATQGKSFQVAVTPTTLIQLLLSKGILPKEKEEQALQILALQQ